MTVSGTMMLALPSLSTLVPEVRVNGTLTFNLHTLAILSGNFSGNFNADRTSNLSLTDAGLPLIINRLDYQSRRNRINCSAVPILFDEVLTAVSLPLEIHANGDLNGNIFSNLNKNYHIAGNDDISFDLQRIEGNVSGIPVDGSVMEDLTVTGMVSLGNIKLPVELNIDNDKVSLNNP